MPGLSSIFIVIPDIIIVRENRGIAGNFKWEGVQSILRIYCPRCRVQRVGEEASLGEELQIFHCCAFDPLE